MFNSEKMDVLLYPAVAPRTLTAARPEFRVFLFAIPGRVAASL